MSIKIAVDCGHGLKTAGKQTPDGIKEWTLNDKVRDKVVSILSAYDCEIIHTDNNEGNTDESLTSRVNKYLNAGAAAFVSIHHNAYTGSWNGATGVEVFTDENPTKEDLRFADCIYGRLVNYTSLRGRGIKRAAFTVINQNKIPAVLVEGGFMDGTNDYKVITSDAGQTAYAKAVAEGLIEFLGLKKKTTQTATATEKKENAVLEWQKAAIADGFKFPKYGADGMWGAECESVAKNALVMRRNTYMYKNLTKIVQKVVGVEVDGLCGTATAAAIKAYQQKHGLSVDGCVGINTWKKILGV